MHGADGSVSVAGIRWCLLSVALLYGVGEHDLRGWSDGSLVPSSGAGSVAARAPEVGRHPDGRGCWRTRWRPAQQVCSVRRQLVNGRQLHLVELQHQAPVSDRQQDEWRCRSVHGVGLQSVAIHDHHRQSGEYASNLI